MTIGKFEEEIIDLVPTVLGVNFVSRNFMKSRCARVMSSPLILPAAAAADIFSFGFQFAGPSTNVVR